VQKHAPWADEPALRGVGRSRRYGSSRKVSACSASTPTLPTAAIPNRLRACLHILPLLTQANVISIGTAELVRFSQSLLERRVCCRGSTYLAAPRLRPVWVKGSPDGLSRARRVHPSNRTRWTAGVVSESCHEPTHDGLFFEADSANSCRYA
jgi:hypothetical protein